MAKGKSGSFRANSLTPSDLQAMENHELRLDHSGAQRSIRKDKNGKAIPPLIYNPLRANRLTQAHAMHVKGAKVNKGASKVARHAFIQFPTDLEITPASQQMMLDQAVAFVNKTHGGQAAFWARIDRDEEGRHGVDVFFAPKYEKVTKRKTEVWISLTKFGKERAVERFKQKPLEKRNVKTGEFEPVKDAKGNPVMVDCDSKYYQGRAFQDLWFEHLRDAVGLDWVKRGEKKIGRDSDRMEVEEYKLMQEHLKLGEARLLAEAEAELIRASAAKEAAQTLAEAQRAALEAQRELEALRASVEPLRPAVEALKAHEAAEEARRQHEISAAVTKAALPAFVELWDEHGDEAVAFAVALASANPDHRQKLTAEISKALQQTPKTSLDVAEMFTHFNRESQDSLRGDANQHAACTTWDVAKGLEHLKQHPRNQMAEAFDVRGESVPAKRLRAVMDQIKAAIVALGEHLGLANFKPAPPPQAAKPLLDLPKATQDAVRDVLTPKPKPSSDGYDM